ncbi:MAG TPA: aminotransferase class III-fold pyridoxal phosphate-dependent enzyme [Paraburkholderia sp.]|nr:aminotransferase class III-fold pyridoxal phosphate-dependent enzyme [Paraburkholderia sp.]
MNKKKEAQVRDWLVQYTRAIGVANWDGNNASLMDLGIDSVSAAELLSSLETWMGVSVPANMLDNILDTSELISAILALQSDLRLESTDCHAYEASVNPWLAAKLKQLKIDRTFTHAEGMWLFDECGERYLDFMAQYGALPFGHHPAQIWSAIESLRDDGEPNFAQPSLLKSAGALAQRLLELAPAGLDYVTFTNSGAESIEAALKMARHATGRQAILSARNSFHGKTFGALSATGKPDYQVHFGLPLAGFDYVEYGSIDSLREALESARVPYAAFLVEPIQGEGGVHVPPSGYLREAGALCRRHGVVFVVDEVQTGLGRTGALFACDDEGIRPDIITLSKALGGGLVPIGAVLSSASVYTEKFALKHSSTFAGNALAARVGLATLDLLTRNDRALLSHVRTEGAYLKARLDALQARHPDLIEQVRGRGFMLGLRFSTDRRKWHENFLGIAAEERELAQFVASYLLNVERVRVAPTLNRGDVLRLQPALIASREHSDLALEALGRTLDVLSGRNTGRFYRAILRRERPATVPDSDVPKKVEPVTTPAASAGSGAHRFAFLLHPLDAQSYADYDVTLGCLNPRELAEFEATIDGLIDPVVGSSVQLVSRTGAEAVGDFIMISHTAAQLRALPQRDALAVLKQAIALAKARGARIVGLGAYTSVVSGGGALLADDTVALTSGNSYTVVSGIEAIDLAMSRAERSWDGCIAAVAGAAGAIGSCMTILLSLRASRLVLVGNPAHEAAAGRERLLKVVESLVAHALSAQANALPGSVAALARTLAHEGGSSRVLAERIVEKGAVLLSDSTSALALAELIVTATSFPRDSVDATLLRPGAIVCDISRPRSLNASVALTRPDVLVLDGGVVSVPGGVRIGPYGLKRGTSFACMAETMLLALEGCFEHTSVGHGLNMREITRQQELARKHGFGLAQLQSFGRPLTDSGWQRFVQAGADAAPESV